MSKKPEVKVKYAYKTRFGSTSDMVVRVEGDDSVCVDEFGEYKTPTSRINSGLADPNRCNPSRLSKLFQGKKEEK